MRGSLLGKYVLRRANIRANTRLFLAFPKTLCLATALALLGLASAPPAQALTCNTYETVKQTGGETCTGIMQCVGRIPATLSGNWCIDILDSATYSEEVFITTRDANNFRIVIGTDTGGFRPVVNPPSQSTAAFQIANASFTIQNITVITTNTVQYGIWASSANVTISSVNIDAGGNPSNLIWTAGVSISSNSSISYSSITVRLAGGLQLTGDQSNVSYSTAANNASGSSRVTLHLNGVSLNTITQSYFSNLGGVSVRLNANADYNTISQSTITSTSGNGVQLNSRSSNTITRCYISVTGAAHGIQFAGGSYNTLEQSTITIDTGGGYSLNFFSSSWNTVTRSYIFNRAGTALRAEGGSINNTVSQSTVASTNQAAVSLTGSSRSDFIQDYISGGVDGVVSQTDNNSLSQSTITCSVAGCAALHLNSPGAAGDNNSVSQCFIKAPNGYGLLISGGAKDNTISQSTITSNTRLYPAVFFNRASTNTIADSYIQGSSAVVISGSTGTIINSSVLVATNTLGSAVWMTTTSVNLFMSSNTITGGPQGAGIYLDQNNTGSISLSTNTIMPSSRYGIYVATQTAGAQVWITSNTILPALSASVDTYGIYLNGLASGATIYNNAVVYRAAGGTSGRTYYALYGRTVRGLNFNHNRISQPDVLAAGSFISSYFTDTQATQFKFNDVNSMTAAVLQRAYLLQLENSTVTIRNNIFSSSMTVSVSSASLFADQASGFDSDYNDWFNSNSANTAIWGPSVVQFSSCWF